MPENLGVDTFPDPVRHFGFCRRCGVAGGKRAPPSPLGWYFFKFFLNPSLSDVFHNFPQAPSIPLTVSSSSTEVPTSSSSIQQSTCTPSSGPPETHPSAVGKELTGALTSTDPRLVCPLCSETFLQNQSNDLAIHVERHDIENMLDCPVCNKLFDKLARLEYENHVETHFPEEVQLSLAERGWDLGFD